MTAKRSRPRSPTDLSFPEQPIEPSDAPQSRSAWRTGVLLPAMISGLALWTAFAPLQLSALAWLAPLGWLVIIDRQKPVGKAGYVALWLSGCLLWLLTLQGVRLAFWALIFGWLAMSLYLAIYTPLFVATARWLVHRWRWPLVIAAPIAWIGMETIRSYLLTGYPGNSLAHTQVENPVWIQSADQFGSAGIAWVMLAVCVAVLRLWQSIVRQAFRPALPVVLSSSLLFIGFFLYGWWKLSEAEELYSAQPTPALRAMLVQENTPTIFEYNPERTQQAWTRYLELTRSGAKEHGAVDLVVWPESTFTGDAPLFEAKIANQLPDELQGYIQDVEHAQAVVERYRQEFDFRVKQLLRAAMGLGPFDPQPPEDSPPHLLVGCDYQLITSESLNRFNSAIFVSPAGDVAGIYNKMHLVMFGEYIPLGSLLKWLGDAFGLAGASPGTQPQAMELKGIRISPNICFESMIPRLIRSQVATLAEQGASPDVLVNLTNDSWFRGSSILNHHLASTILMAVENRRPVLVAANTGLSAYIAGSGRVLQVTQRLKPATLVAEVKLDGRQGLVQWLGYPLSWLATAICLVSWTHGLGRRCW